MTEPVLLLDIDGVVNALSKNPPIGTWPEDDWLSFSAASDHVSFPMLVAKPVVQFINQLHWSGIAEVRWHTTWQHEAKTVAKLAGFDDFDIAVAPEFGNYLEFQRQQIRDDLPTWWKLPAARRVVLEEKRPLIWLDDDLYHEYLRRPEADESLGGDQRTLLVRPEQMTGLTFTELLRIQVFAEEVSSGGDGVPEVR